MSEKRFCSFCGSHLFNGFLFRGKLKTAEKSAVCPVKGCWLYGQNQFDGHISDPSGIVLTGPFAGGASLSVDGPETVSQADSGPIPDVLKAVEATKMLIRSEYESNPNRFRPMILTVTMILQFSNTELASQLIDFFNLSELRNTNH